ncbi:hypothetical protein GCM10027174_04690 [Salinifilum aidingensis]
MRVVVDVGQVGCVDGQFEQVVQHVARRGAHHFEAVGVEHDLRGHVVGDGPALSAGKVPVAQDRIPVLRTSCTGPVRHRTRIRLVPLPFLRRCFGTRRRRNPRCAASRWLVRTRVP